MNDRLAVYLDDHLAGASFAVELLERLRSVYAGQPLGEFAAQLLVEVEEDRSVLLAIVRELGKGESDFKEAAAWLAEKASRLKLRLATDADLAVFEALETLCLGVLGKLALWRALAVVAATDPRFGKIDFEQLAARAQAQHAQIEARRLEVAQSALQAK